MPCLSQSSRRPREERDVSQCESVASTVSAQEDEDIEASNEEENPEDSEGNFSGKETCMCTERDLCFVPIICSEFINDESENMDKCLGCGSLFFFCFVLFFK